VRQSQAVDGERSPGRPALVSAVTLLVVLLAGTAAYHGLLARGGAPRYDVGAYLGAGERARAGVDPYGSPGFYYTPAFASLVGALRAVASTTALRMLYGAGTLVSCWLLAEVMLAGSEPSLAWRLAVALAVVLSPLVRDGVYHANVSGILVGPFFLGLALLPTMPFVGGLLAGVVNTLKPLGVPALLLSLARLARARRRLVAALAGLALSSLVLLIGWRWLPSMLATLRTPPLRLRNIALWVGFDALGVAVPPLVVTLLVTAAGLWLDGRAVRTPREHVALAGVVALLALPVNNPSTFLLTVPMQLLALERALDDWRLARATRGRIAPALAQLSLVGAAIVSVQDAQAVRNTNTIAPPLRGAMLLAPLLAVVLLAAVALVRPLDRGDEAGLPTS